MGLEHFYAEHWKYKELIAQIEDTERYSKSSDKLQQWRLQALVIERSKPKRKPRKQKQTETFTAQECPF